MINDRPPRDARDAKPQQDTGADPAFDFHSNGRNEDVAGRDLPVAELPTLSSPTLRQWYPSSMNTSGPNQSPPSGMESTANTESRPWSVGASPVHRGSITRHDLQGSALNDHPRPFYDQGHMPPRGFRGDPRGILLRPHASGAQLPVTTPIPLPAGFYTGQSHDRGMHPPLGGLSDVMQPGLDSQTPLPPPPQGGALDFTALGMPPPVSPEDYGIFPSTYNDNGGINYYDHGPSTSSTSIPHPRTSYSVDGGGNADPVLSHDAPRQQSHFPIEGTYPSRPEQLSPTEAQSENPRETFHISQSPREGSSRYGQVAPPYPIASGVRAQSGAEPSGSIVVASDDPPIIVQNSGKDKGKRKRLPEDVGGATRSRRRAKGNASLEGTTPVQTSQTTTRRRIKIEQPTYICGNSQHGWIRQEPIEFLVDGQPGIRLKDALDPQFSGLNGRNDGMFQYAGAGSSISCRINFPGYKPRSSQITTADHKKTHNPKTRGKLASEVAKRIERDVEVLKIGMRYRNMFLTKLVHVSKASWQPEIWYEEEEPAESSS